MVLDAVSPGRVRTLRDQAPAGGLEERRQLEKRFGERYRAYKQQVPRRYLTPWLAAYLGIAAAAFGTGVVL